MVGSAAVSRSVAISTEGAATIRPSDDPSHFLANLLHLVYRGKKLKADLVNAAQELLLDDNPELMPELLYFMSDTLPLLRALLHEAAIAKIKPAVWWLWVERSGTVSQALCNIAHKLLLMPAS